MSWIKPDAKPAEYWAWVRRIALAIGSDGCTKSLDLYVECCYEHDIHWRTGVRHGGQPITRMEANAEFRRCIQSRSTLGRLSPMSWWRWGAVSVNAARMAMGEARRRAS